MLILLTTLWVLHSSDNEILEKYMNIQRLNEVLNQLHLDSLEIEASALISDDGITLASNLTRGLHQDHLGAMSAALLSLGDRMIKSLSGETDRVMIQSKIGYIIVTSVAKGLLLTVVTRPDAQLGMVFHDIKSAAKSAQKIVSVTEAVREYQLSKS